MLACEMSAIVPYFDWHSKHPFPTTQEITHGHHKMVSTEVRLIIFFAVKDEEALYSQQKKKIRI